MAGALLCTNQSAQYISYTYYSFMNDIPEDCIIMIYCLVGCGVGGLRTLSCRLAERIPHYSVCTYLLTVWGVSVFEIEEEARLRYHQRRTDRQLLRLCLHLNYQGFVLCRIGAYKY